MKEIFNPFSELNLEKEREILLDYFAKNAVVQDQEKGYIFAPWVNLEIDPILQGYAADLVAYHFKNKKIDIICGIPTYGIPFASVVAERVKGSKLVTPRKGLVYPPIFGSDVIITDTSTSFTTGEKGFSFVFPSFIRERIDKGKNHFLFVDDFCALGETACSIIPSLQELGAKVSYAVYVSKNFQGGLERVKKLGVDSFAVVEIKSISPEGKIILVN